MKRNKKGQFIREELPCNKMGWTEYIIMSVLLGLIIGSILITL